MNIHQMKKEMHHLAEEFKKYQGSLGEVTIGEIANNKELMNIFASLYHLMQSPLFFEVLCSEGFIKSGGEWTLASPIAHLAATFYRFMTLSNLSDVEFSDAGSIGAFSCTECEWNSTWSGLDSVIGERLLSSRQDEIFLGLFDIDLRSEQDVSQYENIIKDMRSNASNRMTAVVFIYNGVYTESLFFIKNENKIEVLAATNSSGAVSHIHRFTDELIKKYD